MRTLTTRFFWPRWVVLAVCLALVACGVADEGGLDGPVFEAPETAVSYTVAIKGLPAEDMQALAEASLTTYRQMEAGAQSIAFLRRRAENDIALIQKLLRSRGYFAGDVDVDVAEIDDKGPPDKSDDARPDRELGEAVVTFTVKPGEAFVLARHDFRIDDPSGTAPELTPKALGSPVGAAAAAEAIVNAETAAVEALRNQGFPYAARAKRRAVADLEAASLEIDTPLATGPAAVFGSVQFEGLKDVSARYLLTYLPWKQGDRFDRSKLRTFQTSLLATDLFDTVSVRPPADPPPDAGPIQLPVTVIAEERPFRTVSAGARYSTDDGPSVTGGFEHRNLFGENEVLSVEAELGVPVQRFAIGLREPQYRRPGQDLVGSLVLTREEDDAFDQLTATGQIGIERRLTPRWLVGIGVLAEISQITDDGVDQTAILGGIPTFAQLDTSDDLLNPTEGARLRLEATPYAGSFDGEFAGFLVVDATGSAYQDVFGDKAYILAGRARFGTILSEDLDTVPQTRRLYAGGGGSVRGYAQRFVGPLDALDDPIGGRSALEIGGELRARFVGDLGGVLFLEAGAVSGESFPDFQDDVQLAAGVGVRYFSPAGPIRVDLALPLNPRDADDAFQLYFSIGQAF